MPRSPRVAEPKSTRPDRPETRRDATRVKLLKAARKLFLDQNYFEVSIDTIVAEAGLSRATFYLHYPSRDAMIGDIVRDGLAGVDTFYRHLNGGPNPTKKQLREFIEFRVEATRKARREIILHYKAASYNPEVWQTIVANRDRHMHILGETIPAFKMGPKLNARERRRRAAAHLLLIQVEQTAHYAIFAPDQTDLDVQISVLVDAFADFIKDFS